MQSMSVLLHLEAEIYVIFYGSSLHDRPHLLSQPFQQPVFQCIKTGQYYVNLLTIT